MFVVGGNIIILKAQSACTAFCVWLSNSPQIPIMMIQNTRFLGDQHEYMMV